MRELYLSVQERTYEDMASKTRIADAILQRILSKFHSQVRVTNAKNLNFLSRSSNLPFNPSEFFESFKKSAYFDNRAKINSILANRSQLRVTF